MSLILTILIFLLVLSFLVLIHEAGHFFLARKNGVRVEEFGIGYPPRAAKLYTDRHGTEYTLNWLPVGGFVRLYGEDQDVEGDGVGQAFYRKKPWVRLAVIVAGAVVNFLFGVVVFGAIYTKTGIPTPLGYARIDEVVSGSPADVSGVQAGDRVIGAGVGEEQAVIGTSDAFIGFLAKHVGETIELTVMRGEENSPQRMYVYIRRADEVPQGQGAVGVVVSDLEFKRYAAWQMPFRGMWVGLKAAVAFGGAILVAFSEMIGRLITAGVVPSEVSGPVGIVYTAQKEGLLTSGFLATFHFMAILSINLAIINLLPFPALDGGRAALILVEMLFGARVKPSIERWLNAFGMATLLLLIVLISVRDVRVILGDEGVRRWWMEIWARVSRF